MAKIQDLPTVNPDPGYQWVKTSNGYQQKLIPGGVQLSPEAMVGQGTLTGKVTSSGVELSPESQAAIPQGSYFNKSKGTFTDKWGNQQDISKMLYGAATPSYTGPTPTTTPSGYGNMDVYETLNKSMYDYYGGEVSDYQKQLDEALAFSQQEQQTQIVNYQNALNAMYEPQFMQLEEDLQNVLQSSNLAAAAHGSVRGQQQDIRVDNLTKKADAMRLALEAEKGLKLEAYQKSLQGITDKDVQELQDKLANVQSLKQQAANNLELAKQDALGAQIQAAADVEVAQMQQFQDYLAQRGMVYNPMTGEISETLNYQTALLEQEKIKSDIANQDATTSKIYADMQKPNVKTTFFSDEKGIVSAVVQNIDTGEMEIIDLGKLDAGQKWALGVTSGGGAAGGDVSYTPQDEAFFSLVNEYQQEHPEAEFFEAASEVSNGLITAAQAQAYYPKFTQWYASEYKKYQENQPPTSLVSGFEFGAEKPKSGAGQAGQATQEFLKDYYNQSILKDILGTGWEGVKGGWNFGKGLFS